ncbi:MAG: HAMP domain-containing histidine kinase [Acidobacteriota bacterium]|jgi:two-component system phosphate regulon sensor histidine kinase PhoR|nr:HAMP domain-containing histidine kinase [Acidobacteriota bacterium]
MKLPFLHNSLIIFLTIGLIVVSTAVLSFVSFHYAVGRENLVASSLDQSNKKLVAQHVDRIEQKIVDNDLLLAGMIDVNDPEKWPEQVEAVKKADLNVEQVYLLDPESRYPLYPKYSPEIRNQWGAFRANFDIQGVGLEQMTPGQPHHLHRERANDYFFVTYIAKETAEGKRLLVCFQMNFDQIRRLLTVRLSDLEDKFYVSVVDYDNNVIYGQPLSRSFKVYEERFHSTLYKWMLQIRPRDYEELEAGIANERRSRQFFITLSMLLTVFSLAIIYVGWRRDRQLRQLKDSFISNVSHELKTPLSLISMFSEMLATDRVRKEEKKREYYRIIHSESDRMTRLIGNLLDFANLSRGVEHKHFERINIARLVSEALEGYRYETEKAGVAINAEIAPDVPDSLADPNSITMAFLNLLDNAVKYSGDQKEIDVRVSCDAEAAQIVVKDRGIGIPLSEQDKIFDKFYRVNTPATLKVRGSGIGLAITRHVAKLHGGEVSVRSEPGRGSEFTLKIPLRKIPENLENLDAEDDDMHPATGGSL